MMPLLMPQSIMTRLAGKGISLSFGLAGRIVIPTRSRTPTIACSFVGEGLPIPVAERTTAPDKVETEAELRVHITDSIKATEREIDIAVRDIVTKAFDRATEVLQARRADLDDGARLLLAQETVTADQFPAIRSVGSRTKSAA